MSIEKIARGLHRQACEFMGDRDSWQRAADCGALFGFVDGVAVSGVLSTLERLRMVELAGAVIDARKWVDAAEEAVSEGARECAA